jgi:hypothetical protein
VSARFVISLCTCLAALACTPAEDDDESDSGAPACVDIDYSGCALLYPATYSQVWAQTLAPSCGGGGSACHETNTALRFQDPSETHQQLLDGGFVVAGDPACSHLLVRLESDDPSVRMPPGNTPIAEGARCSIATWIANGAAQD